MGGFDTALGAVGEEHDRVRIDAQQLPGCLDTRVIHDVDRGEPRHVQPGQRDSVS